MERCILTILLTFTSFEAFGAGESEATTPKAVTQVPNTACVSDVSDTLVASWTRIAEKEGVPDTFRERVSLLIEDGIAYIEHSTDSKPVLTQSDADAYRKALINFVRTRRRDMTSEEHAVGTAYWLAYCVLEAVSRGSDTADLSDPEEVVQSIRPIVENAAEFIDSRLRNTLRAEALEYYEERSGLLLSLWKERVLHECRAYQGDFLFPGYRRTVESSTGQAVEALLAKLEFPSPHDCTKQRRRPMMGFLGVPTQVLVDFDEVRCSRAIAAVYDNARTFINHALLTGEVHLDKNRFWGHMQYGTTTKASDCEAEADLVCWPVTVWFTPWDPVNEAMGWRRDQE